MFVRVIHLVECSHRSFFLLIIFGYWNIRNLSILLGHFGLLPVLTITDNAAMNILVNAFHVHEFL